jgi:hypothetical protein
VSLLLDHGDYRQLAVLSNRDVVRESQSHGLPYGGTAVTSHAAIDARMGTTLKAYPCESPGQLFRGS